MDALPAGTIKVGELSSIKETKSLIIVPYTQPISNYKPVTLHQLEKDAILTALTHFESKTAAAEALGITIKTLYNKLHEYGEFDKYRRHQAQVDLNALKDEVNFKNGSWGTLSKTQVNIALLLLKAKKNNEIMDELGVTRSTLDRYISIIKQKTGVTTREQFIVKFSKTGQ